MSPSWPRSTMWLPAAVQSHDTAELQCNGPAAAPFNLTSLHQHTRVQHCAAQLRHAGWVGTAGLCLRPNAEQSMHSTAEQGCGMPAGNGEVDWSQLIMVASSEMLKFEEQEETARAALAAAAIRMGDRPSTPPPGTRDTTQLMASPRGECARGKGLRVVRPQVSEMANAGSVPAGQPERASCRGHPAPSWAESFRVLLAQRHQYESYQRRDCSPPCR